MKKDNQLSILDMPMDWRTIFDLANIMMVFIDDKQNVSLINWRGCEMLGYKEREIVGKNWFDNFLPKENVKQVKHVFDHLIKGKVDVFSEFENYILTKSGEKRMIQWHNTYLKDKKGRIRFTLSAGHDVTEHRAELKKLKKENVQLKKKK